MDIKRVYSTELKVGARANTAKMLCRASFSVYYREWVYFKLCTQSCMDLIKAESSFQSSKNIISYQTAVLRRAYF